MSICGSIEAGLRQPLSHKPLTTRFRAWIRSLTVSKVCMKDRYVDGRSIMVGSVSHRWPAHQQNECCQRRTGCGVAANTTSFLNESCIILSVAEDHPFPSPVTMIMAASFDPQLCSTSVLEDADNHDDIIGLKLSYVANECFFTVCISDDRPYELRKTPANESSRNFIANLIDRFNEACTWTEDDVTIEDIDKRLDPLWQEAEDLVKVVAFDNIKSMSRVQERIVPSTPIEDGDSKTLAEYICPRTFNMQLVQGYEGLYVVWRPDLPPALPFAVEPEIPTSSELMRVRPKDIKVLERYRSHVLKVEVHGHVLCCKLNNSGAQSSFLREFETLKLISDSNFGEEIRIPRLQGVVASDEGVIGLLIDLVKTEAPDLMSLLRMRDDIKESCKQRWKEQISNTVGKLHNLNITWGDAKTSNVLIDQDHNAWLVDFGGGFTRGWVDERASDTQEGDLQGLENTILDIFNQR